METLITQLTKSLADGQELIIASYPILRHQLMIQSIANGIFARAGFSLLASIVGFLIFCLLHDSCYDDEDKREARKTMRITGIICVVLALFMTTVYIGAAVMTPDLTLLQTLSLTQ